MMQITVYPLYVTCYCLIFHYKNWHSAAAECLAGLSLFQTALKSFCEPFVLPASFSCSLRAASASSMR